MTMAPLPDDIARMRAFNRFYTRQIGVLDEALLDSPFSLAEARLLFELNTRSGVRAADLARELGMDPGQMSRLIGRLKAQDILATRPSAADGRVQILELTETGRAEAQTLADRSNDMVGALLSRLDGDARQTLIAAMGRIEALLAPDMPAAKDIVLRGLRIGDLGWLTARQGQLYHTEYGWDQSFEALVGKIYSAYATAPEAPPKNLWVADWAGVVAGSVAVVPNAEDPDIAQLRLLFVEPFARGQGLGKRLVAEAVGFAKNAGYKGMILWTQDCLVPALKIYETAGFTLEKSEPHTSFGAELVGLYLTKAF